MKNVLSLVIILVSRSLLAQTAPAPLPGKFNPATGQTFFLDLDTAAGKFSQWRKDDLEGFSALRTELRIERLVNDATWFPTFTIMVASGEAEGNANSLSVQFIAPDHKAPLIARIVGRLKSKPIEEIPLSTKLKLGERVVVEVSWAEANLITVRVGERDSHTIRVPWKVDLLRVTGSTGEVTFDPLVLGTASR